MNFCVQLLLLVKCFYLTTAHPKVMKEEGKIIGGSAAKSHSHPYMVSLQTRFLYIRMHFCGGVLLNKRYVLSAAHCATESWLIRWLPMDAVAGIDDVNKFKAQTQVIQIMERIPHPLYNGGIGPYDIGLYKSIAPFTYTEIVQPIKLSDNFNYKSHPTLKLAGWGVLKTTMFIPDMPSTLQEVTVTYIPIEDCYKAIDDLKEPNEDNPLDKESNICTGPLTGGIAACAGDSGGPLIQILKKIIPIKNDPVESNTEMYNASLYDCPFERESDEDDYDFDKKKNDTGTKSNNKEGKQVEKTEAVLLGIVSWGVSPCGEKGAPTVYTNVTAYKDFIDYNIKIL